ncbi:MAG TPA: hypothetical protein VF342_17665 [Alphaproteobacteria bacterium]
MTQQLNNQFVTNAPAFAQNHVLHIVDIDTTFKDLRTLRYDIHHIEPQQIFSYKSVDSASRVVYGDINPGMPPTYNGLHVVTLSQGHQNGYFPLFWLPYANNETRKITLVDKRTTPHGGVPRIFLTSAVNGCTVVVEGTEEAPTVYHLNAIRETVRNPPPNRDQEIAANRAHRDALMARRWQATLPPSRVTNTGKRAGQTLQNPVILSGAGYYPNWDRQNAGLQTALENQLAAQARTALGVQPNEIAETYFDFSAIVFGWMDTNNGNKWRFYIQRRARVTFRFTDGRSNAQRWLSHGVITQFWPGAGNTVTLRDRDYVVLRR